MRCGGSGELTGRALLPPSMAKFLFLAAFLPLCPTPPLQPRTGRAGGPRCRCGAGGTQSLHEDPKQGSGKGVNDDRGASCPSLGVPQTGNGLQAQQGPSGSQPTPASGFSWAESERGKAFPVPGPGQTSPAPPAPGHTGAPTPFRAPKGCPLPQPCPSCPLCLPGVTVTHSCPKLGADWETMCALCTHR